jgi:hypothetical protein
MRIPALALALATAAMLWGASAATADDENIKVYGTYLTDSDGYDYGVNWYLDSTVNAQTCVYPTVTEQTNVNGSVTAGPVILQANETGFSIGQFVAADQSQGWASNVSAKWQKC